MKHSDAVLKINAELEKAHRALDRAVEIADETGRSFDFEYFDRNHHYESRPMTVARALGIIESGEPIIGETKDKLIEALRDVKSREEEYWQSSTAECEMEDEYGWTQD